MSFNSVQNTMEHVLPPVMCIVSMVCLVIFGLWWRSRKRSRSLLCSKAKSSKVSPAILAIRIVTLLIMGFAMQILLSIVLNEVLSFFPEVAQDYQELMELVGFVDQTHVFMVIYVALLAPIVEEVLCRGLILDFALQAWVQPCSNTHDNRASRVTREAETVCINSSPTIVSRTSPRAILPQQFWAANAIQALLFAIMHFNIVQGSYAFLLGLLLGWLVWRTGQIRWAVLLHVAVNVSSYILDSVGDLLGINQWVFLGVSACLVAAGIVVMQKTTAIKVSSVSLH